MKTLCDQFYHSSLPSILTSFSVRSSAIPLLAKQAYLPESWLDTLPTLNVEESSVGKITIRSLGLNRRPSLNHENETSLPSSRVQVSTRDLPDFTRLYP